MTRVNIYAVLTTLTALLIAAAVLAGSLAYRARQRRTSRLGRLEDAVIGRQIDDLAAGTMAPTEATQLLRELRYLPAPGAKATNSNQPVENGAWDGAFSFPDQETGTSRLGYRIFKWLLFLGFFLLIGLMGYAWWTYPTTGDATRLLPLGATLDERLRAVQDLRRDWLQQVKDLGQVFVLTPIFPLLGTVVGYLFGVRRSGRDRTPQAAPVTVGPEPEQHPAGDSAATQAASEAIAQLAEANESVPSESPAKPKVTPTKVAAGRAAATENAHDQRKAAVRVEPGPADEETGVPATATVVRTDGVDAAAPKRTTRRSPRRTE